MSFKDHESFIRANTAVASPPLCPEIKLHMATEVTPLWQATETVLEQSQLPPPYWAFAWPGGQALARHILDHPELVAGKTVLDIGAGCGLVAIAAARAGARVTAAEPDDFACAAIAMNAALNGVSLDIETADLLAREPGPWQAVLAGDMCYERPLAGRLIPWLARLAGNGALVARYDVPTSLELEDQTSRETLILRLVPE
jgi:predicted nicotinamide N-methyase